MSCLVLSHSRLLHDLLSFVVMAWKRRNDSRFTLNSLPFFAMYGLPVITVLSQFTSTDWHAFIPVIVIFVVVPILDFVYPLHPDNWFPALTQSERLHLDSRPSFRLATCLWPLMQFPVLFWVCHRVSTMSLSPTRLLGLLLSFGLCSSFGVLCSHELVHRHSALERALAELLLTSVWYGHYAIEHVSGHHVHVATSDDLCTMRYAESLYSFFPRAVIGGLRFAYTFEVRRLKREGLAFLSFQNRLLRYVVLQSLFPLLLWTIFGPSSVAVFIFQAFIAVLLLICTNGIEHYGLVRSHLPNGLYEPVGPRHSWDAPQTISNFMLLKLQLHADHHIRKFSSVFLPKCLLFRISSRFGSCIQY